MNRRPRFCALFCAAILAAPLAAQDDTTPIPADTEIVTTDSGLKYSVLRPGRPGASPAMGDRVRVHYTGWLTDGTLFDSSRQRGEPAQFVLGQVIAGWNEALQLMTPGARFKLTIPYQLAYGEDGRPPVIPPEATLIFDVELLSFAAMPAFRKPDPAAQKTTASGLKYEVLAAGEGEAPEADQRVEMQFAFWNTEGVLLQASAQTGRALKSAPEDLRLKFLQEAPLLMKPGARYLFEVPAALAFESQDNGPDLPPDSTTVWLLELVAVIVPLPVPGFVLPDAADLATTESGLQYQVVNAGEGDAPRMGEEVTVHYAGWLTDGTLFDSSFERGEPSTFRLGMVIQGWNEGLQLMKPGAVFRLVIPAQLGYGQQGSPPKIGADATLVFWVQLLE